MNNGINLLLTLLTKLPQNIYIYPNSLQEARSVGYIALVFAFSAAPFGLAGWLWLRKARTLQHVFNSSPPVTRRSLGLSCVGR